MHYLPFEVFLTLSLLLTLLTLGDRALSSLTFLLLLIFGCCGFLFSVSDDFLALTAFLLTLRLATLLFLLETLLDSFNVFPEDGPVAFEIPE